METLIIRNSRTVKRLKEGYLWIFSNELIDLPDLPAGELIQVKDKNGNNYGIGFYNRNSLISVRLLLANIFDEALILSRIQNSFNFRRTIFPEENSYRLVFGESDLLPGLIIDKYENYFSIQILSAGMEYFKNQIVSSLLILFPQTEGINFRNELYWRNIEGLSLIDEIGYGKIPDLVQISENGIKYQISLNQGQKTGYFFDQRLNRQFLSRISNGLKVLDLFTNQGGFGLNAAKGGASYVLGVDISQSVVEIARNNAELNSYSNVDFITEDVFDFLKNQISLENKFDLIICDPPAFAKNKKSVINALIAYKRVNLLAMKCLNNNGILLTSSCSQHIDEYSFYDALQNAALEGKRRLVQFYRGNQSPDHPIIPAMKETNYLKFFGFIVL